MVGFGRGTMLPPDAVKEMIAEETIQGHSEKCLPVNRTVVDRLAALITSQLELPDQHCNVMHPLRLAEDTLLLPHIQVFSSEERRPALVIEFFDERSRESAAKRRRLYERGGLREYWAIYLDVMELERYVLLEGTYLHPHLFAPQRDTVFSVVLPDLCVAPSFFTSP